ncbi:MAG: helix-turn-helix domain-containing protein [Bacillota bacterium]
MSDLSQMTLGQRIRYLRLEKKRQQGGRYSLEKLAARLGGATSKQVLSLLERDKIKKPSSELLHKLAAEFGVTLDFLVTGISGNKEQYLQICQELERHVQTCPSEPVPLLPRINRLWELLGVLVRCLRHPVHDSYDLYIAALLRLRQCVQDIRQELTGTAAGHEQRLELLLDQSFWRLGQKLRLIAAAMDAVGGRNFSPHELEQVADLLEEVLALYQQGGPPVQRKMWEINLPGASCQVIYQGTVHVPGELWREFEQRLVFELGLLLQKAAHCHPEEVKGVFREEPTGAQ